MSLSALQACLVVQMALLAGMTSPTASCCLRLWHMVINTFQVLLPAVPPVKPTHVGYDAPDALFIFSWHQRAGAFAKAAMGVKRTGNVLVLGVTVSGNLCSKPCPAACRRHVSSFQYSRAMSPPPLTCQVLNQMLNQMLNPKHGQHDMCMSTACWPLPQVSNMVVEVGARRVTERGLLDSCETPCTRPLDGDLWPTPTTPAGAGPGIAITIIYPGQASRTRDGCVLPITMAGKLCMRCAADSALFDNVLIHAVLCTAVLSAIKPRMCLAAQHPVS